MLDLSCMDSGEGALGNLDEGEEPLTSRPRLDKKCSSFELVCAKDTDAYPVQEVQEAPADSRFLHLMQIRRASSEKMLKHVAPPFPRGHSNPEFGRVLGEAEAEFKREALEERRRIEEEQTAITLKHKTRLKSTPSDLELKIRAMSLREDCAELGLMTRAADLEAASTRCKTVTRGSSIRRSAGRRRGE